MQNTPRSKRRLLTVLFAAGLLILVDQAADLVATLLSGATDFSAANWRFGLFGLLASRASALLIGDVMLFTSAVLLDRRGVLRVLGALHLVLAAGALAGFALFILDAVQVHRSVPVQSINLFSAAVFRAGVVALAGSITLGWAGAAAWRTASPRPRSRRG